MPCPQEFFDVVHDSGDVLPGLGRHQDDSDGAQKLRTQYFAFGGRKGEEDQIILVLPRDRLPLGRQDTDHPQRDVPDANLAAHDFIAGLEQVLDDGFPKNRDFRR